MTIPCFSGAVRPPRAPHQRAQATAETLDPGLASSARVDPVSTGCQWDAVNVPSMELRGQLTEGKPLIVVALKDEAQFLSTDLPVLVTGLGKVNAAIAVAATLNHRPLPSRVVNLGTAGALRAGLGGLHSIGTVLQHDLDADLLHSLTGEAVGAPIEVAEDGLVLASGDVFVSDDAERERLGAVAHLADMGGTQSPRRPPPLACQRNWSSTSATRPTEPPSGHGRKTSRSARGR